MHDEGLVLVTSEFKKYLQFWVLLCVKTLSLEVMVRYMLTCTGGLWSRCSASFIPVHCIHSPQWKKKKKKRTDWEDKNKYLLFKSPNYIQFLNAIHYITLSILYSCWSLPGTGCNGSRERYFCATSSWF